MKPGLIVCGLLIGLTTTTSSGLQNMNGSSRWRSRTDATSAHAQPPYQRQGTWYEFILGQFNPDGVDYGNWIERERHKVIELRLKNPYFLYSVWTTIAAILTAAILLKQRVDHQRAMSITSEMMADLYNQDAYSRQVVQEAIERYNRHIERCNRVIEGGESPAASSSAEIEHLRMELMRVAEGRDTAIRDRDVAREELRRKSEIVADMSLRLNSAKSKTGTVTTGKVTSDLPGADANLVTHINGLQEQLYSERNKNRRLRGG